MEIVNSTNARYLAKDRVISLRISKKEEVLLKNESKLQKKNISNLVREGFLNKI
jgi:hypothetical protein